MSVAILLLLVLVSMLHRRVLGGLGWIVLLPGNVLHEVAHAVATLLCGYSVAGFRVSAFGARGEVRPGPAWAPWARPGIADLVAPIAPLGVGIAALYGLHAWSGAPGLPLTFAGVGPVVTAIPWRAPELWVAIALAAPVSAEMCPSDVDLRAWRLPALIAAVVIGAAAWASERWAPGVAMATIAPFDAPAARGLGGALSLAVWSTGVWAPVAWVLARIAR